LRDDGDESFTRLLAATNFKQRILPVVDFLKSPPPCAISLQKLWTKHPSYFETVTYSPLPRMSYRVSAHSCPSRCRNR
jgi:hypothetical protein